VLVRVVEIAEETGLIVAIGTWVLAQACEQAARWRAIDPNFTVAVNVSGRQRARPIPPTW
jgi:EAL domain-containing protein (putative c-di-GMP-specific phosphodiesterase class I)